MGPTLIMKILPVLSEVEGPVLSEVEGPVRQSSRAKAEATSKGLS